MVKVGIIGGSGIYDPSMFDHVKEQKVRTPFGTPGDSFIVGSMNGIEAVFLSRHGRGHKYSPTDLNYRANIYGMKKLGVTHIISVSAVGSLKESLKPLDIVIPDQVYDRTTKRVSTYFEGGIVAHISFADPFCRKLSDILYETAKEKYRVHNGGTYLCMEGPQFSTKAESRIYRKLGFDVIGMTALPEAKLAREAEICFAILATITDYDVWYEEPVSIGQVIEYAAKNEEAVKDILRRAVGRIEDTDCPCRHALEGAIATSPDAIPEKVKRDLKPLIGPYIK
ncbi:5'-methylthioadenosine phosphorylase [Methanocella paludicola SANAE]|uniref:S-methyl-5'-thioadenosine phosphorylase n=1 Tax=Methanocella paludicola (strain DSM 17711 / JCM 13418 / NBRC 101707 / SANAE) TaxID=304371 RepID=D1YZM1_METPS|nr:S-methyl-5'-thioadenosine phosphorylase [Methanocella paludicola]BAI61893.1 5'-methylthioadenosine phosphorylase [Methanocella paludicola SANAE]